MYADNGAAWNVGSIERVCTEEDECRLSAVPHLRVHDSAYLPEQIGWKFSTLWQRGVGDSAWLAWDASASCWVHDGGVRTQAGSMPLTSERLALYCVLGAVDACLVLWMCARCCGCVLATVDACLRLCVSACCGCVLWLSAR